MDCVVAKICEAAGFNADHWQRFLLLVWLLLIEIGPSTPAAARAQEPLAKSSDYWYGTMETDGRQFRFIVEASTGKDDASPTATLISLDEGDARFELTNYLANDTRFEFELPATKAKYQGKFDVTTQVSNGTWEQRSQRIPLRFERREKFPTDKPTEIWEGTINAGIQKLLIRLRIYRPAGAPAEYYIDSVTQKAGGFIATGTADGKKFSLDIPAIRGKFTGEFSDDGESLTGSWSQGLALNLEFKRIAVETAYDVQAPRRPQHPQPPYAYRSVDVQFPSAKPENSLAGTLTMPTDGDPFPLAILIGGSGPQDRDGTLLGHKPFLVLGDHLTRHGIAVLRFDERGVGKSSGNHRDATTEDFAQDVAAAVKFARTRMEIDPRKIGLIGHSEGGTIAPMVAARDSEIAWIVLMAGPGVNGEQILYSQGQLIVAAEGGDAKALASQRKMQESIFDAVKQNAAAEWDERNLDKISSELEQKILAEGFELADDKRKNLKVAIRSGLIEANSPWFRFFLSYEPAPTLKQVRCPVLVLNGGLDLQVDPKLNLPKIKAALAEGGNQRVTVRELPGLNHLFQTCETGAVSRYATIEETLAPLLLETIEQWLQQQR